MAADLAAQWVVGWADWTVESSVVLSVVCSAVLLVVY